MNVLTQYINTVLLLEIIDGRFYRFSNKHGTVLEISEGDYFRFEKELKKSGYIIHQSEIKNDSFFSKVKSMISDSKKFNFRIEGFFV